MSKWLKVGTGDIQVQTENVLIKGVDIQMGVSQFDIPTDVRGQYDASIKRFVIELQYLDRENTKAQKLSQLVSISYGENSGRIFKILIDIQRHGIDVIKFEVLSEKVKTALEDLSKFPFESPEQKENADIIRQIVASKQPKLLAQEYP